MATASTWWTHRGLSYVLISTVPNHRRGNPRRGPPEPMMGALPLRSALTIRRVSCTVALVHRFDLRVGIRAIHDQPETGVQPSLGFPHFKRRKQGSPPFGGTEQWGISACRSCRPTVRNLPMPAKDADAPGRWRPRKSAMVCRTRRRCEGSSDVVFATNGRPGWSRRRDPAGLAWCGRWPSRTTGAGSPCPDGCGPPER